MSADLAQPIRAMIVGASSITSLLPAYLGGFPVFTRRPAPDDAPYPMIMVSPDVAASSEDAINDQRPVIERDVAVYGKNTTADEYRETEAVARAVHALFQEAARSALSVPGWHVIDFSARWPTPAPTDDEQTVGRVVPLTIRLAKHN